MSNKETTESVLEDIHKILLRDLLEDLKNPDKRTPQLYNAVIKELERNGIDCIPKAGEEAGNTLKAILDNVTESLGNDVYFTKKA